MQIRVSLMRPKVEIIMVCTYAMDDVTRGGLAIGENGKISYGPVGRFSGPVQAPQYIYYDSLLKLFIVFNYCVCLRLKMD